MVQELVQTIPEIKSVVLNLNTREDNVILGKQEEVLYGESFITDEINGLKFHISAEIVLSGESCADKGAVWKSVGVL